MSRAARNVVFFRRWSPEMAYVLGYWWADGYMYLKPHGAHEIEIASVDREHLETIAETIGINYHLRQVVRGQPCYELTYCSKEMYQDLARLGGTPHKSRTIGFPPVPTDLLPHFVRGFVDGDGTLSWNGDRPVLQIYSASQAFLIPLGAAIEAATGIPAPNLIANRLLWYVKWSTIRAKCLAGWLYVDNPGLASKQKTAVALAFLDWHPKKKPNEGTITDAMRCNFPNYLPE
ncbi:MAG TPA: LAGLIDADG family homing endonuclease [Roseiflexaceae bacterium]|nr:LAGLIDADG family homing endonuclease [Roseiflexaceae bacterium]